jgi:nucleotide-binding universal stress UspA family protein
MRILIAVDGSKGALGAVKHLVGQAKWYRETPRVELVNVRFPVPRVRGMSRVVSRAQIDRYYREEGAAALSQAAKLLDRARIPHTDHILIGDPAEAVVALASRRACDLIVMGTHGRSEIGNALLGSVATRVLRSSRVPVQLVR